ncbi:hypothetical protein E2C01_098277 [Portunus trituberculatus]|uniref:Uncharacterized protein n=1 Tax=Portunus trituberculatus TaxID=210409 RepID=A0A5B7K0U2_PORTR|nr:hypothetical protein [Portunus trituberculatus]
MPNRSPPDSSVTRHRRSPNIVGKLDAKTEKKKKSYESPVAFVIETLLHFGDVYYSLQ